jgi:hypothetical protein
MSRSRMSKTFLLVGLTSCLLSVGCLEQDETITVAPNGDVTIEVSLSGAPDQLKDSILLPSGPAWHITERKLDTSGKSPTLTITATASVPYGSPLPESFLPEKAKEYDLSLHFPGTLSVEKQGNRTFYTFKRTYEARRFLAYDYSEVPRLWDRDLESHVLDSGLFKVSPDERKKYLEQLSQGYEYSYWSYNRGALGELVRSNILTDTVLLSLTHEAEGYLDSTLTPDFFLNVMKRSEAVIQTALDSVGREIDRHFLNAVSAVSKGNTQITDRFKRVYTRQQRDYEITQKLDGFEYTVNLIMPGTVISTNGMPDSENPGKVMWSFKGNKMNDADLPLYAVSVATK